MSRMGIWTSPPVKVVSAAGWREVLPLALELPVNLVRRLVEEEEAPGEQDHVPSREVPAQLQRENGSVRSAIQGS